MDKHRNNVQKVLIINTIGIGLEGITSVIYNYVSNMSCNDLELHFIAYEGDDLPTIEKFEKIGPVHILPFRGENAVSYIRALWALLKSGFDAIHIHGSSATMILDVMCARLAGVRKVITHSHNTSCEHILFHKVFRAPMAWMTTHRLACSEAAGVWLYGKRSFDVLNNAITVENYGYSEASRGEIRKELNLHDALVVGHVGYLDDPKNQSFLVEAFHILHQKCPNSKLLLIGEGSDREKIEKQIADLGLQQDVILTGIRSDVQRLYSAMDIFVMPSLWEGLPVSLLEAQANALPILASDVITREVKCLDRMHYLSLEAGPERWAEEIEKIHKMQYDRNIDPAPSLREKGFDIRHQAQTLEKIYLGNH